MNLEKLRKIQETMAKSVIVEDKYSIDELEFVIGVDQAFQDDTVISACVLLSLPELEVIDKNVSVAKAPMPYIPTFLMFREGKPAVDAVRKLLKEKCVIMVDGSGIAHPRRCGLATYIGLKLGAPSIGVTKKKLYGRVEEPENVMKAEPIYDNDEVIGYAIKTCKKCKPIYVSPGHMISPETAVMLVKMCVRKHKLPEPIRLAHELASESKFKLNH